MKWAALVLVLGLTLAVFTQVTYLESRGGFTTRIFDGDTHRPEWSGRIFTAELAKLVHADGHAAYWAAGWFLLSAGAWFAARGARAIAPIAVLGAGTLAMYHPFAPIGIVASEGPILFFFTLAAISRKRADLWWPFIGLVAIPFKLTGMGLVVVAAFLWLREGDRLRAVLLVGAGAAIGWLCARAGGGHVTDALTVHRLNGLAYLPSNWRHVRSLPLICGGTVLAGALAARGPALATLLMLVVAVLCMGQAWEPRIWVEVVALSAGILGDARKKSL